MHWDRESNGMVRLADPVSPKGVSYKSLVKAKDVRLGERTPGKLLILLLRAC
jgi:hypothetical protein